MSRDKTTSQQQIRTGIRGKGKGRTLVKRFDLISRKETTFTLTPLELKDQFNIPEEGEDFVADQEYLEELLDPDDVDLEIVDEDETSVEEASSEFEQYLSVLPGVEPEVVSSPEVSPQDVYSLIVYPGQDSYFFCRFEVPRWMHRHIPVNDKKYIYILRDFLAALSSWLEEDKQDFLRNPTPENFVKNEEFNPDTCIVLQKGFLQQINLRMPKGGKMTESYLSRLYDKIWLFGPEWNMSLSAIFSDPHQKSFLRAWVIEGCLGRYEQAAPVWREGRQYEGFSTDEFNSMEYRFERLDPEEYLYLLCRTAKMTKQIEVIYQAIIAKITEKNHG